MVGNATVLFGARTLTEVVPRIDFLSPRFSFNAWNKEQQQATTTTMRVKREEEKKRTHTGYYTRQTLKDRYSRLTGGTL